MNNKLSIWLLRLLLMPTSILLPLLGLISDLDLYTILFFCLGISCLHLCLIGISVNYIGIQSHILPCIFPHYNYITIPISNKELLIKEIKHTLNRKYTFYIVIVYFITLAISDLSYVQKIAIGMLFISLLFFFTTFFIFFCNSDFKFTWLKRNTALFSIPLSTISIFGMHGINLLIIYSLLLLTISIFLSIIYYQKAIKAMQQPFMKQYNLTSYKRHRN